MSIFGETLRQARDGDIPRPQQLLQDHLCASLGGGQLLSHLVHGVHFHDCREEMRIALEHLKGRGGRRNSADRGRPTAPGSDGMAPAS